MLENYNIKERENTNIPSLDGNGPPCPSLGSTSQMEWELWLNGGMEEREGEWLERKNGLKALTWAT